MRYTLYIILLFTSLTSWAEVNFSADFESGSLGEVHAIDSLSNDSTLYFHITTRQDPPSPIKTNEIRSNRWFYFAMTGVKDRTIALEITYNDSRRPMYSYDNINFTRFNEEECPVLNGPITKHFDRDSVYIAYFTPYTLSHNEERLENWSRSSYVRRFSMGESSDGRNLEAMVISDTPHEGLIPNQDGVFSFNAEDYTKKVIYIHARVHPSETPCNHHLEGVVNELLSDTDEMCELRRNAIIYLLPIANPDGVYGGFSRTNSNGVNFEINYNAQENGEVECAEVSNIKRFLLALRDNDTPPAMMLNLHSQSSARVNYWVHSAKSTSKSYNRKLMLLSALTIDGNPYFKWRDIRHSTLRDYFIEGWAHETFGGRCIAQTFETPYTFYSADINGEWVTIENLHNQARYMVRAISETLALNPTTRATISEPRRAKRCRRRSDKHSLFFGESYLQSRRREAEVKYNAELPAGEYTIYRWQVGANSASNRYGENVWRYERQYTHAKEGTAEITITSKHPHEKMDEILLIRNKE